MLMGSSINQRCRKPSALGTFVGESGRTNVAGIEVGSPGAAPTVNSKMAARTADAGIRRVRSVIINVLGSWMGVHGFLNSHRCRSLSGLNLASVAELLPMAEIATASVEFGADLGLMRHVPSVS